VKRAARTAVLSLVVCAAIASPSPAQPIAEFYRGKTVEILIGAAAAGGYDVASRTLANHMGRHVPGNPTFVVRNMPGATGLLMTNQLYNVGKRDGTAMGMPTSNIPLEQRLKLISPDGSNVKFDVTRMSWIGTSLQEPQVTWVAHGAR
jgi:tripartite-type tricarboxylate transporter receptor subunit TctC